MPLVVHTLRWHVVVYGFGTGVHTGVDRTRGDGFDETIMLRNISTSGVLALVDTSSPIQLDATDLILRVQTATLTLEVPVTLVRVSPLCASQLEAAFRFRSLSTAQRTALDNLRHLLTINRRPVPSRNSAERT